MVVHAPVNGGPGGIAVAVVEGKRSIVLRNASIIPVSDVDGTGRSRNRTRVVDAALASEVKTDGGCLGGGYREKGKCNEEGEEAIRFHLSLMCEIW